MSVNYLKSVPFPESYVPNAESGRITDPFANLIRSAADGLPRMPTTTGGGGGGGFPDVDVRRGTTGAVIVAGTDTMTIAGKNIYWVQTNVVINGVPGFMLVFGSLSYPTAL